MKRIIFLLGIFAILGFGCGNKTQVAQKVVLDSASKVVGTLPEGWGSVRLNTLYKDAKSVSGLGYVQGGITTGFGPKDEKGGVLVTVQLIAVPKGFVQTYEKTKYLAGVMQAFDAGTYQIYLLKPADEDVVTKNFVSSLEYQP